jgi:hypothetical protein
MSIDNVTIHQGYELPNGTNTLAHDVTRLINALTSVDSDVFLRPLASSSTYVGTTAIALNRASAAQALTGITSIDGSAATLTTSRTLWGQSFNGSANVTGNLTSVGNITGSGAISLTTAAASNLSLTSGTTGVVSLDSGTTGAVNIGTGANTKTITIGSSTGTVQLPTAVTKVGQTFLIQGGAVNVTFPTLAGTLVGSGDTGSVTSTMILDGTILNADVNASAAIAGTKISPDFGSQNVTTTGNVSIGLSPATARLHLAAGGTAASSASFKINSGSLLTAAEAGVAEYDGASLYFTTNTTTTGRGQIIDRQVFRLTSSGSALGPTIADYFGSTSSISLPAAGVYEIEYFLYFTKTTTGTVTFTLTASSAPTGIFGTYIGAPATGVGAGTPQSGYTASQAATTAVFPVTTANTGANHSYTVRTQIITNAATTFRMQVTSSLGTVTPLAGSFYCVRRVAATTGSFVA